MEPYSVKDSELLIFENIITEQQQKQLLEIFYSKSIITDDKNKHYDDRTIIQITKQDLHSANFVIADVLVHLLEFYKTKYDKRFYYVEKNTPLSFSITTEEKTDGLPVHYDIMKIDTSVYKRLIGNVLYLNDEFEGGEIVFPLLDFAWKPKPRTLISFPSHFGYPHFVRSIKGKERIIFQGYITYGI